MKDNFDSSLEAILAHEGGFSNHPSDPGGMTNLGVTRKVWEEWVGRKVSENEMRKLTPKLVAPLYKARYWDAVKADQLPAGIDYLMFDFAINAGVSRSLKTAQKVVKVVEDGVIGNKTLAAINEYDVNKFVTDFSAAKENFYKSLPTFQTFGKGWIRRVSEAKLHSETMMA